MEIENFKRDVPYFKRKEMADKINDKFFDRIPVYMGRHNKCRVTLKHYKYLVPEELTVNQMRTKLMYNDTLDSRKAIFFYCNDRLITGNSNIRDIYNKYKSDDGFLYITFCDESVMG